jgi:signal transduction histidine kinase
MSGLIERAVENVGRIITDLRPSILDHQGLWAALEWQAQEFSESTEISCRWRMTIDPDAPTPDGPMAIAVFRIFQEMLSNVARHARATILNVRLEANADSLRLEVADNGQGVSESRLTHPRSYGVLGMRERAGHFGGQVDFESVGGRGTTVRLSMPIAVELPGIGIRP